MAKGVYYGVKTELPDGYTPVEYIESSGSQYIDTGVLGKSGLKAECKYMAISADTTDAFLLGAVASNWSPRCYMISYQSGYHAYAYKEFTHTDLVATMNTIYDVVVDFSVGTQSLVINGETIATSTDATTFTTGYNLYLFGANAFGSTNKLASYRVYHLKIYDNGALVRNFIPAKNSSSVVGLYDSVNGVFYSDASGGTFTAGAEVPREVARKCNKMYYGAPKIKASDSDTLLLLRGDGFDNLGSSAISVSNNGATVGNSQSKFGDGSFYFDGSSYLEIPLSTSGDITIDFWMYTTAFASEYPTPFQFTSGSKRGFYAHFSSGKMMLGSSSASADINDITVSETISLNKWYHVAIVRTGTTVKFYINGVSKGSVSNSLTTNDKIILGGHMSGAESLTPFKGYIEEFRVSIGNKWTANFTPPTVRYETENKEVARKVKKGYLGVNGIARLFFGGSGTLTYYGTATALSRARYNLASATIGDYALFAGGSTSNVVYNSVDVYNNDLTKQSNLSLTSTVCHLAGYSNNEYAIFAGGFVGVSTSASKEVCAFDRNLSKLTSSINHNRAYLAGASIGEYALFAGGYTGNSASAAVNTYDESLTRITTTDLSQARYNLAGATVEDYAIFAGGSTTNSVSATVDAYNSDLARSKPTVLSGARQWLAGASVGNYALFAGGVNNDTFVDAYDEDLTRISAEELSVGRYGLVGVSAGEFAVFAGGHDGSGAVDTVDVYDSNLTRSTATSMSVGKHCLAGAMVGDYVLLAGGINYTNASGTYLDAVDVYTIA